MIRPETTAPAPAGSVLMQALRLLADHVETHQLPEPMWVDASKHGGIKINLHVDALASWLGSLIIAGPRTDEPSMIGGRLHRVEAYPCTLDNGLQIRIRTVRLVTRDVARLVGA